VSRAPRPFQAEPRHPVTHRQIRISARTRRQLDAYLARIDSLREGLRLRTVTAVEVERELARMVHGMVTVERVALAYVEHVAPNTARRVRSWLSVAGCELAGRELFDLDAPTLSRWIDRLRARRMAPSSIAGAWRTLRAIVRFGAQRGWLSHTPWGPWRPSIRGGRELVREREAARTVDELRALVRAARAVDVQREETGRLGDVEGKIAAVALLGLRQGELAGLCWPDVDERRALVAIRRQGGGAALKTSTSRRTMAVDPYFFGALRRLRPRLAARGLLAASGPIFPSRTSLRGAPRAYTGGETLTRRDLRAVVGLAGLPHPSSWSARSLRDTFVTLESAGHLDDLSAIAERSRHASRASLVRYQQRRSREPVSPGFTLGDAVPTRALPPRLGDDET
jgi:integrase